MTFFSHIDLTKGPPCFFLAIDLMPNAYIVIDCVLRPVHVCLLVRRPSVHLSVCLLSACPYVYLSLVFLGLSIRLPARPFICVCLSFRQPVCPPTILSDCWSVRWFVRPSVHTPVCPSACLYLRLFVLLIRFTCRWLIASLHACFLVHNLFRRYMHFIAMR